MNATLRASAPPLPPHPLESLASTPPSEAPHHPRATPRWACKGSAGPRPPLPYGDAYVDDFLLAAQTKRHQQRVLRAAALHSIDQVLALRAK